MLNNEYNWPEVEVIWWDADSFYIRCPYCEEIHRHGLDSYASRSRVSHCGEGGSYRYYFPIDERTHRVAYEIDKSKPRFINVCALQDLNEDSDEMEQLAYDFSSKTTIAGGSTNESSSVNMYEAAQETVAIQLNDEAFEEKRIIIALSDCVRGRVAEIQQYLHDSPDALIFIQGRDYKGDTTLIMASREQTSAMVSLLLDHGSNVNAVNSEGRSALMEAALWGRLDNAKVIIRRGADISLRDCKKRVAADLSQPTWKNQ